MKLTFPNGHKEAMAANLIADNIFVSVDEEVHRNMLLGSIDDSRTSGEYFRGKMHFLQFQNGTIHCNETTKGWEILIQWKDISTIWTKIKDVKDSYPVELA